MFPIISFFCQNLIIPRSIIGNRERPCLNIRRKLSQTIVFDLDRERGFGGYKEVVEKVVTLD